jgi:hypothetical protein
MFLDMLEQKEDGDEFSLNLKVIWLTAEHYLRF